MDLCDECGGVVITGTTPKWIVAAHGECYCGEMEDDDDN